MANGTLGSAQQAAGTAVLGDETDDVASTAGGSPGAGAMRGMATPAAPAPRTPAPQDGSTLVESGGAVGEVMGEEFTPVPEVGPAPEGTLHEEVGSPEGAESGEEFFEATPEQMATIEAAQENAASDLAGAESATDSPGAEGDAESSLLPEAGAAIESAESDGAQAEFLPILAALVPTLVSTVGPMVARAVSGRLSARAQQAVRRIATAPRPPVPAPGKRPAPGGISNILAVIARLLQNAGAPGRESGMENSPEVEGLITEAVAVLEAIVDTDDRRRLTNTTAIPWRRVCALRIQFPSGATYRGTGFLIGPRALATAGHCVYLHNQGGWARRIEVFPGANGASFPLGRAESRTFRSVSGWVRDRRPESDYGCIVLPAGAFNGRNLGSFGFAAFDAQTLLARPAVVAGYPGDKPFAQLWGAARRLKMVTAKTLIYNTATMGGQSGAPVYIKRANQRYVVGIHNYGSSSGNSATRVTPSVLARLTAWSKL